jgi:hypothetical protein
MPRAHPVIDHQERSASSRGQPDATLEAGRLSAKQQERQEKVNRPVKIRKITVQGERQAGQERECIDAGQCPD